jgi:uncharacterized protein (TIGR03437 family)
MKLLLGLCFATVLAVAQPAVQVRDADYAAGGRSDQTLDLDVPDGSGPFPLLIHVHGGGWRSGEKSGGRPAQVVRPRMLQLGIAFASINYRLSGEAIFPAQINDCKAAVRWLRANASRYRLDPGRFAVWGTSAGGHLAALMGTSGGVPDFEDARLGNPGVSSLVQAVIDWYGPTDFAAMDATLPPSCRPGNHGTPNSAESRLLGCTPGKCPELAGWASPLSYISPDDPPFLIMHGTNDCTVPAEQSRVMAERLMGVGVPAALRYLPGDGHGGPQFWADGGQLLVEDFLRRVFRPEAPSVTSAADYNFMNAAPGQALALFGSAFTNVTESALSAELPTEMAGLSVEVWGVNEVIHRAGLYFVSPGQVNFHLPEGLPPGGTEVRLRDGTRIHDRDRINVRSTAPTLFSGDDSGARWAAGQVAYWNGRTESLSRGGEVLPIVLGGEPAYLVLYGTGFGTAEQSQVRAWIHDEEAAVVYAGPQGQFPGLDQYNLEIPPSMAGRGDIPVSIAIGGVPCNPVRIFIQ